MHANHNDLWGVGISNFASSVDTLMILYKVLHYIFKCKSFWNDVSYLVFLVTFLVIVKIISIPDEDFFPKRPSGAPLHTLSK